MKDSFSSPTIFWPLLTMICLVLILTGLYKLSGKTGWEKPKRQTIFLLVTIPVIAWIILLTVLSVKGFFADFRAFPPRPALAVLLPLPVVLIFAFSKTGTILLKVAPSHWLIFIQSFRIIVEILLLSAFVAGKLPIQMTFDGRNFDILSGILALPVGYFCFAGKSWSRKVAIVYNIVGLLLLLNILVIAVLSMPTPIRYFMNEPANTLVADFPFIFLPGVLVPIAYSMHIFSLRQLLKRHPDK